MIESFHREYVVTSQCDQEFVEGFSIGIDVSKSNFHSKEINDLVLGIFGCTEGANLGRARLSAYYSRLVTIKLTE